MLKHEVLLQYEFLFCLFSGFLAGIFSILNHTVEISFKSVLAKLISSIILGGFAYFLLDFSFITIKRRIAGAFIIAYGGANLLNRIIDLIFNSIEEIKGEIINSFKRLTNFNKKS